CGKQIDRDGLGRAGRLDIGLQFLRLDFEDARLILTEHQELQRSTTLDHGFGVVAVESDRHDETTMAAGTMTMRLVALGCRRWSLCGRCHRWSSDRLCF